jgi:hypothetical protein
MPLSGRPGSSCFDISSRQINPSGPDPLTLRSPDRAGLNPFGSVRGPAYSGGMKVSFTWAIARAMGSPVAAA